MLKIIKSKKIIPFIILLLSLSLTFLVYQPGLKGSFLFDDYYNLGEMSKYGDPHNWDAAKKFIMNGGSGPTGRPISLFTFLWHADSWNENTGWLSDAKPFKTMNLFIHILCGLLLFIVIQQILRSYKYAEQKIVWIALLATSFWLIHPLFVSTILYVIQRMAQLALLFSLIAMIGYFKGRALLLIRPGWSYVIMTLSIGIGTVLATLSKENGALLPLLILVIEYCNPNRAEKPRWQWRSLFLWLPSLAIVVMLARYIDFSENLWANRSFNQVERLWTEGRIVSDYLGWLWMPRIEGRGLLQDGFIISKGWLSPLTTLFSILFLFSLLIISFVARKKYPLIALAILFFFAAHLMESTVLGLELYFEHRNYLAAIFMFLPLAAGLYALSERIKLSVVIFISILILATLALMTWQRATLWSDNDKLELYWARNNPNSERGQVFMSNYLIRQGRSEEANLLLIEALKKNPKSGLFAFQLLLQKVNDTTATLEDFENIQTYIAGQRADSQALIRVRDIVISIINDKQKTLLYATPMLKLLDSLIKPNSSYWQIPQIDAMVFVLQGMLLVASEQPQNGYQHYYQAILKYQDIDKSLGMVADLGNHGYRKLALKLLDMAEIEYRKQPDHTLMRSREFFDEKIMQLRDNLLADIQKSVDQS